MRLWVVSSDYYDDLKIDNTILKAQTDSYRRIRNTFRYLIGNLDGFNDKEKLPIKEFPELECYILHRLWETDQIIKECIKKFNFHLMFTTLLNFCSNDLSAFYFDIRKDAIYCDSINLKKRRAARTLLDIIYNHLVRWLAPSLSFTCEEAWKARGNKTSIHLEEFILTNESYENKELGKRWETIKNIRKVITGALEKKRADKVIGSSLEAQIRVYLSDKILKKITGIDLDEVSITSSFEILNFFDNHAGFTVEDINDVAVVVEKAKGDKCKRCWKYKEKLIDNEICNRCNEAIVK